MENIKDILSDINYMKGGLIVGGSILLLYLVPRAMKPSLRRREIKKLKKIFKGEAPKKLKEVISKTPSPVWLGGTRRNKVYRSKTVKKLKNKKIRKR